MSKETDELIQHFGGLASGTVGDAIIEYLGSSDCSPKTRERIWAELERLDAVRQLNYEKTLNLPDSQDRAREA